MSEVLQNSADGYQPRGRLDPRGFETHVRFQTTPPPNDLAPFVEHFWSIRWNNPTPYRSEEVMHRPYVDLFVSEQESGVQGTFRGRRDYLAAGTGRIVGARFRPGAFHAFWHGPMADLEDRVLEWEQVFPQADRAAVAHWLEGDDEAVIAALIDLLRSKQPRPDENIELIHEIITAIENESLTTVAAVAAAFDRSERWLQQLFQDSIGMGAKWLIQRQRLLAAARRIRETDQPQWAALAYDLGYSSQQHFNNDFKKVVGKTPVEYKRRLSTTER